MCSQTFVLRHECLPWLFSGVSRELATLLRVKPRALFKSLGGYQEKKKHRVVFGGVPYAFPNLGNVIVPFQASFFLSVSLFFSPYFRVFLCSLSFSAVLSRGYCSTAVRL